MRTLEVVVIGALLALGVGCDDEDTGATAQQDTVAPDSTVPDDSAAPADVAVAADSSVVLDSQIDSNESPDIVADTRADVADTVVAADLPSPDTTVGADTVGSDVADDGGAIIPPTGDPDEALPLKSAETDFYDETASDSAAGAGGTAALRTATPFGPGARWRLTWRDEFDGPQQWEDPACYSRTPQCIPKTSWGVKDCPPEAAGQLAQLNKCNWAVYDFYNYMNGTEDDDRMVNAFDWSEVEVRDGQLILGARSQGSSHTDCGNWFDDPRYPAYGNLTTDCAFLSGGVESRTHDNPWNDTPLGNGDLPGFGQAFGRFEVHAKLSNGPGSWPAFWMMPVSGPGEGWPGDGEIDVMESWAHNAHDSVGTFHDADPATGMHFWDGNHWSAKQKKVYPQSDRKKTFFNDWHVWAVEWDREELRFYVDKWLIGVTWNGKPVERKNKEYYAGVPDYPFYWLLNLSIAPKLGSWFGNLFADYRPDADDFDEQELRIDYVRVYSACETTGDFCPWGGSFDGKVCDLGPAPGGESWTVGGEVWSSDASAQGCLGGVDSVVPCKVHDLPDAARPVIAGGRVYTRSGCVENTLQEVCANPCDGVGAFDGYGCVIGVAANGLVADVADGVFFYRKTLVGGIFGSPNCAPEHPLDGKHCIFGPVPAGRTPFVTNDGDDGKFYLEPVCNPTAKRPNCARPCPTAGTFDGLGCRLRFAPSGTSPFVYSDSLYYQALTTDPATACPRGGSWDGANCRLEPAPAPGAFAAGGAFYLPAACSVVPWSNADGR